MDSALDFEASGCGFESHQGRIASMAQRIARRTSNPKVVGSSPTVSYVWMAEWSKALHLSCSLFGGVGSNPTPDIFQLHTAIKKYIVYKKCN